MTMSNFATTCQQTLIRVLVDFLLTANYLLWWLANRHYWLYLQI